jgi:RNA polymerase sigma factor (sigma-70 family)
MSTMHDDLSVVALVARAREGDHSAWNELVERYAPLVWSVCRRHRLSDADCEDVGAAVWLRLVEQLDRLREPAALPGWLATTTRRECLRLLRAQQRQIPVEDDPFPDEAVAASDEWLLAEERRLALRRGFATLPERCRRLLELLFADPPVPYARIGERLGMRVGGIGPSRMRCLELLRRSPSVAALTETTPTAAGG